VVEWWSTPDRPDQAKAVAARLVGKPEWRIRATIVIRQNLSADRRLRSVSAIIALTEATGNSNWCRRDGLTIIDGALGMLYFTNQCHSPIYPREHKGPPPELTVLAIEKNCWPSGSSSHCFTTVLGVEKTWCKLHTGHPPPCRANGKLGLSRRLETLPAATTRIKKNGMRPGGAFAALSADEQSVRNWFRINGRSPQRRSGAPRPLWQKACRA